MIIIAQAGGSGTAASEAISMAGNTNPEPVGLS
jgi:hypothetical protein